MRKTKIICTLGPAVDTVEAMEKLLTEGMDGARFNFSHGTHETQSATLGRLKSAMSRTGLSAALILDTKGPEIRIKTFACSGITLRAGDSFTLRADDVEGTQEMVSVTYPELPREIAPGSVILIDDGLVGLRVEAINGESIRCRVESGGALSNNKSINIPGAHINLPTLTDRDRDDLCFAAENGFDYIAASFVRSAEDVREIRRALAGFGGEGIRIISKIENQQGVDNMEEIIAESDGIMVARGDLGVEVPAARVPNIQKRLISACRRSGKLVIIATQMLDSMIHNPRPTRAEVSDVANAVYDRASCVMLSGETASGKYPIDSLRTMRGVVCEAESAIDYWKLLREDRQDFPHRGINDVISHTCCLTAMELGARTIITATESGYTACMTARIRPACDIAAVTPVPRVCRQLKLVWGVRPFLCPQVGSTDELFAQCISAVKENGAAAAGDVAVLVAGVPIGCKGSTNLMKAQVID